MQERGLKSPIAPSKALSAFVAPYAGAWIEIIIIFTNIVLYLNTYYVK